MNEVNVEAIRSDKLYRKIMLAQTEKKDDIYRFDFMKLLENKWALYQIPLKPKKPGGYDVVMASGMLGYMLPKNIDLSCEKYIDALTDETVWASCKSTIESSLKRFCDAGIQLPVKEYLFTLMLMNPESPYAILNDGFNGDGGIPGYILVGLVPNAHTLAHLPVMFAHETNHNVRYQFIRWTNDVTLGEYMVSEGLAENFATQIFGGEQAGPWVTKTDGETLNEYIKPLIKDALGEQGLDSITAWMFGDEMAALQNYIPAGMPYCAGYACGYYLVKHFLEKTGKTIEEASILPAQEILDAAGSFWTEPTDTTEYKES